MKRYIKSDTTLKQGSYVADRDGKIYDIGMHVPSTTYLGRGYLHLAPTDAEFLLNQGLISEEDALAITLYCCFAEFLEDEMGISRDEVISLTALSKFLDYSEMKWAKNVRKIFMSNQYRTIDEIEDALDSLTNFKDLQQKWYKYLQDNYIKISRYGNTVEFRISSTDGFDWNDVVIDDIILKHDNGRSARTKYNVMKESESGYKEYFFNATLNDILENDKIILSSIRSRKVGVR